MSMTEREGTTEVAPVSAEAPNVKVIKRYTNRKLYDTVESRYVTLEEIAEMVKNGAEVKIVDNRTKDDLTSVTLAQIIFEEEKRQSQMPLGVLKRIIQGGGTVVTGFIHEQVTTRVDALREEAETRLPRIFKREDGTMGPAPTGKGPTDAPKTDARPAAAPVREVIASSSKAFEDWQRRVDERVRSAVEALTGLTQLQREVARVHDRLDALEKKLSELETK